MASKRQVKARSHWGGGSETEGSRRPALDGRRKKFAQEAASPSGGRHRKILLGEGLEKKGKKGDPPWFVEKGAKKGPKL